MQNIIDVLLERGFVDQMTSPDLRARAAKPLKVYIGFDPTAPSLHLGNLVGIMALAWFQKFGHTPYALIGGATGRIGDPSGKSSERPLLTDETLQYNVACLNRFFHHILNFPQGPRPVIVNNDDWLGKYSLVNFLRDVGKYFRVGPMLAKESVRARLASEEGLSFTEFTYQVLQGFDFHYLHQKEGLVLQMGGSDQWGNITAGIEFHRKMGGDPIYGLTFPLLTRSDGKKFGKTEEGAIWLSSDHLSPYQFYQYLIRTSDADVIRLLKMLTFLDMKEIEAIEKGMNIPNSAQKRLAEEVTFFVHGKEGLEAALRVTEGIAPGTETELAAATLRELASDMPHVRLSRDQVVGQKFVDLASQIQLTSSKSEAVRLIKNGGAYFNNKKISDPYFCFSSKDLIEDSYLLLGSGKKRRILIEISETEKLI
jgi:tyrosyl-tRNA synthetase